MLQLTGNSFCLNWGLACIAEAYSDSTKQKRTSLEKKMLAQTVYKSRESSSGKGPGLETGKQRRQLSLSFRISLDRIPPLAVLPLGPGCCSSMKA